MFCMFVCLFVWFFRRDLYSDFRTITTTSWFQFFVNYKKIACLGVVIQNVVDNPLYASSMTVGVVKTCYGNDGILVDENVELDLLSNDSCRFFSLSYIYIGHITRCFFLWTRGIYWPPSQGTVPQPSHDW